MARLCLAEEMKRDRVRPDVETRVMVGVGHSSDNFVTLKKGLIKRDDGNSKNTISVTRECCADVYWYRKSTRAVKTMPDLSYFQQIRLVRVQLRGDLALANQPIG
ncbi:hypothetical protein RRG08_055630 [Elysia crispata]|uniref:Uncharacterized protein n=1 Tax=Elysia crispata TaxID=231223 RepID=A0AAE0Z845_9GAST|nr:hypothetical protein RRG08_055630 [Elysia crispata]